MFEQIIAYDRKKIFGRKLLCPISEFCALFAFTQNKALPLPNVMLQKQVKWIQTKYSSLG